MLLALFSSSVISGFFIVVHQAPILRSAAETISATSNGTSLTWESINGFQYFDPDISWWAWDSAVIQNVYEPLLWYNSNSSTQVIPWLAENYTLSPDGKVASFVLRNNIKFADGNPLNSTAVYFSLNRILIEDGSTPSVNNPSPCLTVRYEGLPRNSILLDYTATCKQKFELVLQRTAQLHSKLGRRCYRRELCADNRTTDVQS